MSALDGSGDNGGLPADEWQLRCELAAAYRLAAHFGWDDGIATHFSLRLPGGEHAFLIAPFGSLFEEVTASTLIKVALDGRVLTPGEHRVNLAGFTIHSGIHAARMDANCVMHCHTVAGVAVGAQAHGLLPLSGHAMALAGRVGYHGYEGISIEADEIPRMVANLGVNDVLMLRNHGTLTLGSSVAACFWRMSYLERACQMQVAAMSGGTQLVVPEPGMAQHIEAQLAAGFSDLLELHWAAMVRKLNRLAPDYCS